MNEIQGYLDQQATQWIAATGLDIESVSELSQFVHFLTRFFKTNDERKWFFRGEQELFGFPATPSVFRGNPDDEEFPNLTDERCPSRSISDQEISEIERCQTDRPDGADRYIRAFMPTMHSLDVNWLPLARHFGYKTRLLDVTINPLVALYFACSNGDSELDGYVYAMQSGSFRPLNQRNPVFGGHDDYPHTPASYLDLYDVDVEKRGDQLDEIPYHFETTIPQERLIAQSGSFVFWRKRDLQLSKKTQLVPIRICGGAKSSLLQELTALAITETALFPNE